MPKSRYDIMRRYMPKVDEFLHYRLVDVSTVKELCRRWTPESYAKRPAKHGNHRAMDDVRESVEELRRTMVDVPGNSSLPSDMRAPR